VTANISGGSITGFTVLNGGNYPGNPTLAVFVFDSGGGSGATAAATLSGTAVNAVTKLTGGSGYTNNTYVTVAPTAILPGVSPPVTAVCGVPSKGSFCGLGYSNPDGTKAGTTTLQNQPARCFNLYYGSDGPGNTDPIIDWVHGGGGVMGSPDSEWYVLPSGANPGVVPTVVNRGSKFNFYAHAYTLSAAVLLSPMNATTTTATVSYAGITDFPTTYTSCFNLQAVNDGTGAVETMKVTGISGTGPWNYTVVRGRDCLGNASTAGSHTVNGQYAWFTDSNGNSPTYPAGFNDTECFAAFLSANAGKGQIPGDGMDIRPVGFSHGTAHVYLMRALGTQLYNPANCEWKRPASTPFTRFAGISGVFDWAAISNVANICSQTSNCSVNGGVPGKSSDGTEPFFVAATAGAAAWGLTGPNPTNGSVTIGACGANGLAVTHPTSANAIVSQWSPQSYWSGGQCASGGGHCWGVPVNPLPPAFIATGAYDGDVSADTQNCFASQVPGVTQLPLSGTCDGTHYVDHSACTTNWSGGDGSHLDSNSPAVSALINWITAEGFTVSASPASLSIPQGNQGTSTITTTISGGFNSPISLSASGAPSGTTVSFNPQTIPAPGAGNSTMTITVGGSTPLGTYPITVTGDDGETQQNAVVSLTVTSPKNFTISASPASLSVQPGNQGNSTITTTISGGFNSAIALSASGMPSGTTVGFMPNPIPAPGAGSSTITITVGGSTPLGTYPITVTGKGGGIQQTTTVTLTVASAGGWSAGFDFRNSAGYVGDPPGDTYVLSSTAYPTTSNGVTYGWMNTSLVQARDRNARLDPRLAGINFATNGSPATFYVDLPSSGTYNLALALGDAGYMSCWVQCQVQFLDGNTVLANVTVGSDNLGYFYDPKANNWSAAAWPTSNVSQQVTLVGTRLKVIVGASQAGGDSTPIAFLGVAQASGSSNFTISASPASLSVRQGNQGMSTITTTISGGFNSAIALSASGAPSGTTVSFNPSTIPAPGAGTATMTITVGGGTPLGTYPITVTGKGGGIQQNAIVTLTVTGSGGWQQGFDFRNTQSFVTDPPGDNYVLSTTAYPTKANGVTYGWVNTNLVQGRDRNAKLDPRLAGVNLITNGSPATFYVDLPSSGTYNLSLAMGDAGYQECWVQCQIQFLDGNKLLATVTRGAINLGYFYDAKGNSWSAAAWPTSNVKQQVTLTGTRLTVIVGTNQASGDMTPIAFLGVSQ
jgi:hypothetical protein